MTERDGPAVGSRDPVLRGQSAASRGVEVFTFGLWVGLTSGLLIVAVLSARRLALGRLLWHSHDFLWMTPLAQTFLLGAVAVGLALLASLIKRPIVPIAVGVLVFLGAFSVLLLFPVMARWAAGLLALGMAVQAGRVYGAGPERWRRRIRSSTFAMAVLVVGLGIGSRTVAAVRRERGRASVPPAAAGAGAPNVLLIILDTVRRDHLSLYGYQRPTTPNLDRWAAGSAVFDRAVSTAPWTLPSHGSLFTGQLGGTLGGDWKVPIQGHPMTLATLLRSHGYATGGFVANLLYVSRESGLTDGFVDFLDYPVTGEQILLHSPIGQTPLFRNLWGARSLERLTRALRRFDLETNKRPADEYRPAGAITDGFLEWQQRLTGERPFFGMLNYFDAHGPYRGPDEALGRFGPTATPLNRYDGAISYLDSELERLFRELERRGVLDRTVVVVTSDHGELFGEHELTGHANALYLPLLRVPLLIRYPRAVSGRRIPELTSLRDVPATILDLVGIGDLEGIGGRSLVGLLEGKGTTEPPLAVAELSRGINVNPKFKNARTWLQSAIDGEHHYIRDGLGAEELFQWSADSLEQTNVADRAENATVIARFRVQLDSLVGRPK